MRASCTDAIWCVGMRTSEAMCCALCRRAGEANTPELLCVVGTWKAGQVCASKRTNAVLGRSAQQHERMALLRVQIEEAGSCSRMCRPVEGPLQRRVKERVGNKERERVEEDGEDDVRATPAGLRASARARQAGERGSDGAPEPNRRRAFCAALRCAAGLPSKKRVWERLGATENPTRQCRRASQNPNRFQQQLSRGS